MVTKELKVPHLTDPKVEELHNLLERRETLDCQCYMILAELEKLYVGSEKFNEMFDSQEEAEEFRENLQRILREREKINDAFLHGVCGR